jgi:hypothetical protein
MTCLLGTQSNCTGAVNAFYNLPFISFNRFNLSFLPLERSKITLRAINIGTGTTGTRSINQRICQLFKVKTIHYDKECNTPHLPSEKTTIPVQQWIVNLVHCSTRPCFSTHFLISYPHILTRILTQYEFVSDFPMGEILTDLVFFVPNLIVISSLRDPRIWARRRLQEHAQTPICHPSLWDHALVHHPFDLIACLTLRPRTNEALIPISALSEDIDQLISAYIQYNSYNYILTLSKNISFTPLCLWDTHQSSPNNLQHLLSNIWSSHSETQSFLLKVNDPPTSLNRPQWQVNSSLPVMRRLFKLRYESELTQVPPFPRNWVIPQLKLPLLASSTKPRTLTFSSRVVVIAPRASDLTIFHSFLCDDPSSSQPLCEEYAASLLSMNSSLSMIQKWHHLLLSCLLNPSPPRPLDCLPRILLIKYDELFLSLVRAPVTLLTLSTGDHLSVLLLLCQILHSTTASSSPHPLLLLTLHYPPLFLESFLAEYQEAVLVCHPSLWSLPILLHPLDLVTCLQFSSSSSLSSNIVPLSSLSSLQIHQALEAYSQHLSLLLTSSLFSHTSMSIPLFPIINRNGQETLPCAISQYSYLLQLNHMVVTAVSSRFLDHRQLSRMRVVSVSSELWDYFLFVFVAVSFLWWGISGRR